jgi:GT2 family glycosyltransferase
MFLNYSSKLRARKSVRDMADQQPAQIRNDDTTPFVSVIVCTYNRSAMLGDTLNSLLAQKTNGRFDFEIVVIDDGSTDGTAEVVEAVRRKASVPIQYFFQEGGGLAHAHNTGLSVTSGPWIAFLDDDEIAEPDWLDQLLSAARAHGSQCVGGSNVLQFSDGGKANLGPVCRSLLGETTALSNEPYLLSSNTMPGGGNVLFSRTAADAAGGFDDTLVSGNSDTIFFAQMRKAGFELWVQPSARIYHIIPPHRLESAFLLRNALRWGDGFARRSLIEFGPASMILECLARIVQALIVHLPRMIWSSLSGIEPERLDRQCLVWRCLGYTLFTLEFVAPWLPVRRHLTGLNFRSDRRASSVAAARQRRETH